MQTVCEKLYIPTRTAPLYPFGQPAAAVEEAKAVAPAEGEEAVTTGNMLDEAQVSFIFYYFLYSFNRSTLVRRSNFWVLQIPLSLTLNFSCTISFSTHCCFNLCFTGQCY